MTRVEAIQSSAQHIEAYRISGSLFFGAIGKMDGLLDPKRVQPRVMILDLARLLNMDNTGLETLETLHAMLQKRGSVLILCGLQEQPQWLTTQSGLAAELGPQNIVPTLGEAFGRAKEVA